jgi:ribosomal protein S20
MYYELSKSQKKIARKVMDKGLDNHYRRALSDVKTIIQKWDSGTFESNRDAYMKLFQTVDRNDYNIARTYNNKGGSRWVEVMAEQLHARVISPVDLDEFDEDVRNTILLWSGINKE